MRMAEASGQQQVRYGGCVRFSFFLSMRAVHDDHDLDFLSAILCLHGDLGHTPLDGSVTVHPPTSLPGWQVDHRALEGVRNAALREAEAAFHTPCRRERGLPARAARGHGLHGALPVS
ncbi:hypothetical protein VaNZ11_000433 [Volvox africanus]|uniref:Uncharacterized protein n=1 Tax=Volvox africanus TaxID=51714 RepID=A0ABQ5RM91_9CHLO|nr:hypothetical protein VaNZ11_000433 [Volvox africanus]